MQCFAGGKRNIMTFSEGLVYSLKQKQMQCQADNIRPGRNVYIEGVLRPKIAIKSGICNLWTCKGRCKITDKQLCCQ